MTNVAGRTWPNTYSNERTWPKGIMPEQFNAWAHGRQPNSEAEAILSQATAWYDARYYRQGDRFLRNRGSGGEALDMRLGSSMLPNSNDPLWLAPEEKGYVYLPGIAGNHLQLDHVAGTQVGDTLDIRIETNLDVSQQLPLAGKYITSTATQNAWYWSITTSSRMYWLCTDGTNEISVAVGSIPSIVGGTRIRLRALYLRNDGTNHYNVSFWYSTSISEDLATTTTWTQIGTTQTGTSIGALRDLNTPVVFGSSRAASAGHSQNIYRIVLIADGTAKVDIDCNRIRSGDQTTFTALTEQTVNIIRATSGRKVVAMPNKNNGGQPLFLFGTDDYMEVQGAQQHKLLNFTQLDSYTAISVIRRWPTQAAEFIVGKSASSGAIYPGWGNGFLLWIVLLHILMMALIA